MKRHTPQLESQRTGAQTDDITHMQVMQPREFCFNLFCTLTHVNVTAGLRGLPEGLPRFLPFHSHQSFHFSSHIHTNNRLSINPFLQPCIVFSACIVIIIHSQQLFHAIISHSDCKQTCLYAFITSVYHQLWDAEHTDVYYSLFKYICFSRQFHRI